jgi:hypothetical protein
MIATELDPPGGEPVTSGLGRYILIATALCSLVAAGIHFAFAPAHFNEVWSHGAFFVAIAWLQLAWGLAVLFQPRRWLLVAGVILNLGIVGVWVVSRTAGLPFGLQGGPVEAVGMPDTLCTVLEVLVAVGAGVVAWRPSLVERPVRSTRLAVASVSVLGVGAVVLASMSLTPAWAGEHDDHAGHAAGHVHTATAAFATGASPCEQSGPPSSPEQVANTTQGHQHRGPQAQVPIDEATRVTLEAQQADARAVAAQFPTAAAAMRAGYRLSVVYVPCIGAHYTNIAYAGAFDPKHPSELLYDGSSLSSKIVGLSYLLWHPGGPPAGFAGPNDHWHQHTFNGGLCLARTGVVIGGEATSASACEARGGHKASLTDIWMLHDWVVPGWECSWGVFAPECPELGGRTGGTAFDIPTGTSRQAAARSGE